MIRNDAYIRKHGLSDSPLDLSKDPNFDFAGLSKEEKVEFIDAFIEADRARRAALEILPVAEQCVSE